MAPTILFFKAFQSKCLNLLEQIEKCFLIIGKLPQGWIRRRKLVEVVRSYCVDDIFGQHDKNNFVGSLFLNFTSRHLILNIKSKHQLFILQIVITTRHQTQQDLTRECSAVILKIFGEFAMSTVGKASHEAPLELLIFYNPALQNINRNGWEFNSSIKCLKTC